MAEANHSATIVGSTGTDKTRLAVTGVNTAERPAPESAGFRMVTVSFLAAGVGSVHMPVKHQVLALAAARPARDHIGTSFFNLLPSHIETKLL